jgi:uncharacterized protein
VAKSKDAHVISWGPIAAVVVTVFAYFASNILGPIILSFYPLFKGWSRAQTIEWYEGSILAKFVMFALIEAIAFGIIVLFLRWRKATLRSILFIKPKTADIGSALIGFGIYFVALNVVVPILQSLIPALSSDQKQDFGFDNATGFLSLGFVFVSLVILPAFIEELMMRGFLYHGLKSKLAKGWAVLITSLLFGIAHLGLGSGKPLLWLVAIDTFILSVVLIYLVEKYQSLWPAIILHMTKNSLAFYFIFVRHSL